VLQNPWKCAYRFQNQAAYFNEAAAPKCRGNHLFAPLLADEGSPPGRRGVCAAETISRSISSTAWTNSFNEAAAHAPRKRRSPGIRAPAIICFNEATAHPCRGNPQIRAQHVARDAASMRPRRCCGNGQRGRGTHAAETHLPAPLPAADGLASMRPRHVCRGNRRSARSARQTKSRRLNDAAAQVPRKTSGARGRRGERGILSMRPRRICRGNQLMHRGDPSF
jgi:hypothetical protein